MRTSQTHIASLVTFQPGDKVVHSKYNICHHIGSGQGSTVYSIGLKRKGKQLIRAIKIQHEMTKCPQIGNQIQVLKSMQQGQGIDIGFPKYFEYGSQLEYNYLVMELLGPNLAQLLKLSGGKLKLKTVLILGLQIVDRLQTLHNVGWVYRDIQPENFVMGLENKSPFVYMIDFGKCKRYRNKQGTHIPYKESTRFDGEIEFSSVNTHTKTQYSRRDDIQALIYMMIYLRKGRLPWSIGREIKTRKQRQATIEEIKKKVPPQNLTFKMPLQFNDLLTYTRTLNFYQKPDYDYIRVMLHRCFDQLQQYDENSSTQQKGKLIIEYDWGKLGGLDFSIYVGHPKIVQRNYLDQDQQALQSKYELLSQQNTTYKSLQPPSGVDINVVVHSQSKINDQKSEKSLKTEEKTEKTLKSEKSKKQKKSEKEVKQVQEAKQIEKSENKKMKSQLRESNHIFDFLDNFK